MKKIHRVLLFATLFGAGTALLLSIDWRIWVGVFCLLWADNIDKLK